MLTFVFLFFIALFAIAGIAISVSARKRRSGGATGQINPRQDRPAMGRANSEED